jgi:hydroxypyruvate isomerase
MAKLAANLSTLYTELDMLERLDAAARSGFRAVEIQFPYAYAKDALAERLERNRLTLVLHNLPPGDWAAGERGIACHPDRVGEFQDSVGRAVDYATALGCRQLNCLAGIAPPDAKREAARATFVANLRFAADKLEAAGIRLLIEAINTHDIPGFFLSRSREAFDIIRETGSANAYFQYDVYHMQRMEGELANTIRANLPLISHIQIADTPGRHEPGTGEINFAFLFRHLDAIGYDRWIGCEYRPLTTTIEGLGWRAAHGVG